jgi:sulfate adenylyltransferase subunit 1 (EFTu-like GTPase family)
VQIARTTAAAAFRYPVQLVLRPTDGFRGYAGRIRSGTVRVGDTVQVWPSGVASRVARIVTYTGDLECAWAPMSVVLTLADEVDVSRGDTIAIGAPKVCTSFRADVVWMDERPLDPSRLYRLKHTTRVVAAEVDRGLALNEIGSLVVTASRPLVVDSYVENRGTGSFVLIDPDSNFTAGAGMIVDAIEERAAAPRWETAAKHLAAVARDAPTEGDAVRAVRHALDGLLR